MIKPNKKLQRKYQRQKRLSRIAAVCFIFAISIVTLAGVGLYLAGKAQLIDLNNGLEAQEKEIEILNSENDRMLNELLCKTSTTEIDKYIKAKGMDIINNNQFEFIEKEIENQTVIKRAVTQ